MKKIITFLITLIVGFLLFGVMIKIVGSGRIKEALFLFLSFKGLIILIITFLSALISIQRWKFILRRITNQSKFKELGKMWLAGFATTYLLTPISILGGEPVRVYLAKKSYSLSWKKSFASVIIDRILDWTLFLIFTMMGIFALLFYGGLPAMKLGWIVILFVGGLFSLLLFFYFKSLKKESTLVWFLKLFGVKKGKIKNFQNNNLVFEIEKELINFLSLKKKIFWQGLSYSFLKFFLLFFRVSFLLFFLVGETNLLRNLAIYGFNNIALIFPVPATLGSLETTGILSFKILGWPIAAGTIFAMTLRGVDLILSLIGIIFLLKFTAKLTGEKILDFIKNSKE